VLDEAITLFAGVCPEQRPDHVAFYPLRQAIAEFLSTLAEAHLEPKGQPPPAPSLDPLREAGITTVKDEEFRLALATLTDRRRLLLGLVEEEAWRWEDVARSSREIVKRMEISDL
jgi:DNA-binding transcriptional ArsR family regulator